MGLQPPLCFAPDTPTTQLSHPEHLGRTLMQRNTGQARRLVLALALLGALFWGAPARAAGSELLLRLAPGGGRTVELVADARGGDAWDDMQVPSGIFSLSFATEGWHQVRRELG